jgi:hypothetical protein
MQVLTRSEYGPTSSIFTGLSAGILPTVTDLADVFVLVVETLATKSPAAIFTNGELIDIEFDLAVFATKLFSLHYRPPFNLISV